MTGFSEEPRATYSAHMDKAAFFAWLRTRDGGRYELKDGEIIVHAGSTRRHAWLIIDLAAVISARLDRRTWAIGGSDVAVEIGDDIRYPDLVIERVADDGSSPRTQKPVVIFEILSPSSVGRDMREKRAEYAALSSLAAYIVASQDEPIVWVWQRDAAGEFPAEPVEIAGRECEIAIDTLSITLPLAEVYRGIGTS